MKLVGAAFAACLAGALALLAPGFLQAGRWNWAAGALACGLLLAGGFFYRRWLAGLGFFGVAVCCAVSALYKVDFWQPGLALVLALAAWDLASFATVLRQAQSGAAAELPARHLTQLGLVLLAGCLACLVALNVQIGLGFEVTLALAVIMIFGLARAVQALRERDEP